MNIKKKEQLDEKTTTARPQDQDNGDHTSEKVKEDGAQSKDASGSSARGADNKNGESGETLVKKVPVETDDERDRDEGSMSKDQVELKGTPKGNVVKEEKDEEDSEEDSEEETDAVEKAKEKLKESIEFKIDISKDLGSLLESEDLNEEFKSKATLIFETAVNQVAKDHIQQIQENAESLFEAAVEAHCTELDGVVDKYTTYAVNEWAKENEIALESGIMVEQAKSLFVGLKELMTEHNLDLDEEQVAAIEESTQKQSELEEGLDAQIDKNIELSEEVSDLKKQLELEKFVSGMVETQAEKIRGLAEELDFEKAETFREKLGVLKETYYPAKGDGSDADMITEDADVSVVVDSTSSSVSNSIHPEIAKITEFMGKYNRK